MNPTTVRNIAALAADCFDRNTRAATRRASVNLQQIGQIAEQELTGPIRRAIGDLLCNPHVCAVVKAERIVAACRPA